MTSGPVGVRTGIVAVVQDGRRPGDAAEQMPGATVEDLKTMATPYLFPVRRALAAFTLVALAACGANPRVGLTGPATDAGPSSAGSAGTAAPAGSSATTGAGVALGPTTAPPAPTTTPAKLLPGAMPPVLNASDVYSAAGKNMFSPTVANHRRLVYVPSPLQGGSGTVDVIDQDTMEVVDGFVAGSIAQHVVPSWDLSVLYVNASAANQLVPIDPVTGKPGTPIKVERPYNLYFLPDGTKAVVQNEQNNRLDYYDPTTWKLIRSVPSTCKGNNHADWSADGSYFIVTCEFSGEMIKVDSASGNIVGKLSLGKGAMPQDVRLVPDGSKFYVADMMNDVVWIIPATEFKVIGKIPTDVGAHGIYPSRDGTVMYVANRGRHMGDERRRSRPGEGSVSVIDPKRDVVVTKWPIPDGGSPDMGGVSADGTKLWLSGRFDSEVYVIDTATGALIKRIKVRPEPHGLVVWPQPGRYNLGHTGNLR